MNSRNWLASASLGVAGLFACETEVPPAPPSAPVELASQRSGIGAATPLESAAACPERGLEEEELERVLRERVNEARRQGATCGGKRLPPAAPLERSPELECAARAHATAMAQRGFFSHLDPDGLRSSERALRQGFAGIVAENLAWGQATPEQVVSAWLQSPGHCAVLMSASHSLFGVGHAEGAREKPLWVMVIGERRGGQASGGSFIGSWVVR